MTYVRSHMTVEVTLDECVSRLQKLVGVSNTGDADVKKSRIPSWVCYDEFRSSMEKSVSHAHLHVRKHGHDKSDGFTASELASDDEHWDSAKEDSFLEQL